MRTMLVLQIALLLAFSGGFTVLVVHEETYDVVRDTIVNVLCLSCMKLTPATELNFTFDTANNEAHPPFILENLSDGVVFLAFREDVCSACDIMEPFIQDIFDVQFEKEETVVKTIIQDGINVTLLHISLDHSPQQLIDLYPYYDQYDISGVPMFTTITYGYNRGTVMPVYATAYGTLQGETSEEQLLALEQMIDEGVLLYQQNHDGGHT